VLDPHGMPADPCTPEELREKFVRLAARVRSQAQAAAIAETVERTAELPDVQALSMLLRA
jgi:hypothetical protein